MKELRDYLLDNMEEVKNIVGEINSWDGSLDYLEYYENDEEFFNMCFEGKPMEVARAVYYGDYNFMDEYIHFNGYGNLESCSEDEYEEELKDCIDEIIDRLIEEKDNLYLNSEVEELINNMEE